MAATKKPIRKKAARKPAAKKSAVKKSAAKKPPAKKKKSVVKALVARAKPAAARKQAAKKAASKPPRPTTRGKLPLPAGHFVASPPAPKPARRAAGRGPLEARKKAPGVKIATLQKPEFKRLFDPETLAILADLHEAFNTRRLGLLARRLERRARLAKGETFDFPQGTRHIRASGWRVPPLPGELADRRVEVALPPDAVASPTSPIALKTFVDFEDAAAPTWTRTLHGHAAMVDHFAAAPGLKPRGLRLPEAGAKIDGEELSGGLFDLGLFARHAAPAMSRAGVIPRVFLGGIEGYLEARLWGDALARIERRAGLSRAAIKTTVIVDSWPALFELDEIMFEIRERAVALVLAPSDVAASRLELATPDEGIAGGPRSTLSGDFLSACRAAVVRVAHRRGALALVSLSEDDDPAAWVAVGFDGALVRSPLATDTIRAAFPAPNQLETPVAEHPPERGALGAFPAGAPTRDDVGAAITGGVEAARSWLAGGKSGLGFGQARLAAAHLSHWLRAKAETRNAGVVSREMARQLSSGLVDVPSKRFLDHVLNAEDGDDLLMAFTRNPA